MNHAQQINEIVVPADGENTTNDPAISAWIIRKTIALLIDRPKQKVCSFASFFSHVLIAEDSAVGAGITNSFFILLFV